MTENQEFKQPALLAFRQEVLRDAVARYEAFYERNAAHPLVRMKLGAAYYRLGTIYRDLGPQEVALEKLSRARDFAAGLSAEFPDDTRHRHDWANSLNTIGVIQLSMQKDELALGSLQQSRLLFLDLIRARPDHPKYVEHAVNVCTNLSALHLRRRDAPAAVEAIKEGIDLKLRDVPVERHDAEFGRVRLLYQNLALVQQGTGRLDEALEIHARLVRHARDDWRQDPKSWQARHQLVVALYNHAAALLDDPDGREAAEIAYRQALPLAESLVEESPHDIIQRDSLAIVQNGLARTHSLRGEHEAARDYAAASVMHLEKVIEQDPANAEMRGDLSECLRQLAQTLRDLRRPAEAGQATARIAELWPNDPGRLYNAACELSLAAALVEAGRSELSADELALRDNLRRRAVDTLADSLAAGFRELEHLRVDPDLNALRDSPLWAAHIEPLLAPRDVPARPPAKP